MTASLALSMDLCLELEALTVGCLDLCLQWLLRRHQEESRRQSLEHPGFHILTQMHLHQRKVFHMRFPIRILLAHHQRMPLKMEGELVQAVQPRPIQVFTAMLHQCFTQAMPFKEITHQVRMDH